MTLSSHSVFRLVRLSRGPLLLAALALLAGCGKPPAGSSKTGSTAPAAVTVEVAQASLQPISASYNATASLEAPIEAQVVARTSGVLLELRVEEGDRVTAGQVLARIDPARPRLEVERADALLRKLEAELARSKELFERKLVAADVYEKIRFDVDTQRAVYRMAKLELSYTDITAPISGVVAQRAAKVGNLIQLNSSVFRIVDTARLEATLNVPEREIGTLRVGAPVELRMDALPGQAFVGRIDRISPVVDSGSGTFRVVCAIEPDARLRPGMFGRIGVLFDQRQEVLTVPREALVDGEGEAAVYRIVDGRALRTPVQLGYLSGELAEIRAGLDAGDQVVTTGKVALRDGAAVEIIGAAKPAPVPEAGTGVATDAGADADATKTDY